ncbi:hypothetical protein ACWCYZ_45760 [Streptomyces virginiae]
MRSHPPGTGSGLPDRRAADHLTLAEIARLAWTGRAHISALRSRHGDFPEPVGGTAVSPRFQRAAAVRWLRAHGLYVDYAPATVAGRSQAWLLAVQTVRALAPGAVARGFILDAYLHDPRPAEREHLDALRAYTAAAGLLDELAPLALAFGHLTADALRITCDWDEAQVRQWLSIRTDTVRSEAGAPTGGAAYPAVNAALGAAEIAHHTLWRPSGEQQVRYPQDAERAARAVLRGRRAAWSAPDAAYAWELVVAAAWHATWTSAAAFDDDAGLLDVHFARLAQALMAR